MSGTIYTSNVPNVVFGDAGIQVPTEPAVLVGTTADINTAFGGGVNPDLATPQGQLATSQAAIIGSRDAQMLALFNSFDPAYASGRAQDALGRLYFLTRLPAIPTVVQVVCTGQSGVVIPQGSIVPDASGNLYSASVSGTIGSVGNVVIQFASLTAGPIQCAAGSINGAPYQTIPGWDTATNPSNGVTGQFAEGRAAFEARRAQSVTINSLNSTQSVRAAVLQVAGVIDCFVYNNPTAATATVFGVTVAANSLYVSVSGGDPTAVATAIWSKMPPGCAYNGATSVTVYDAGGPALVPYVVSFQTAAAVTIAVAVTIQNNPAVPSNALTLIQNVVLAAFGGADGRPPARIGSTLFALRYAAGIEALGSWVNLFSITISVNGGTAGQSVVVTAAQIPTLTSIHITLILV